MAHVISSCGALAKTKYMQRHNAASKILFFEFLKDLDLIQCIPPWYSPVSPKPEYKNDGACAYWDVPVFAENTEVRANRIVILIYIIILFPKPVGSIVNTSFRRIKFNRHSFCSNLSVCTFGKTLRHSATVSSNFDSLQSRTSETFAIFLSCYL